MVEYIITQTLYKIFNHLPNYYMLCNDCANITQHVKNITHMHRFHASIVTTTRTMTLVLGKLLHSSRCFLTNLHNWQEFYTTAGRAKYQLYLFVWEEVRKQNVNDKIWENSFDRNCKVY